MESTLPFEYGFLYRIIQSPNIEQLKQGLKIDTGSNYYSNSYGSISGHVASYGISEENFYHPIGFIESKQLVVVEIMVNKEETTSGHLSLQGMSFATSEVKKSYREICRATIEVNTFIKNFEKVL